MLTITDVIYTILDQHLLFGIFARFWCKNDKNYDIFAVFPKVGWHKNAGQGTYKISEKNFSNAENYKLSNA